MLMSPGKMLAEILQNDLYAFVHRSFLELNNDRPFWPNWHLEVLCDKLKAVADGKCRRLIINIPPRQLKSHTASIAFPAWVLGRDPTKQILCVSYAQEFSEKLARECRKLMQSDNYLRTFKTRISEERQAVADFETTQGGNRFATSVNGIMTGRGADIIIIDDPLKADDAGSELRRKSVNEWFDNTLRSRLNNQETGAIIVVMQRLHTDDLVGHVLGSEEWDIVRFPAIAPEDQEYQLFTPFGKRVIQRRKDDVLQPELVSADTLAALRSGMTPAVFAAQYQQDPQPAEGNLIKRAWLKTYKEAERPAKFDRIVQSWDTANSASETANFSVCTTWGMLGRYLYLLHVYRRQMEFPELKRMVRHLAEDWTADLVLVEDKASGTQIIQEMRAEQFLKVQATPKQDGDKEMRTYVQTSRFANGEVLVPEDAPWLDAYIAELTSFPNSKYADQVDSTVNFLAWVTGHAAKPKGFFDTDVKLTLPPGPNFGSPFSTHRFPFGRHGFD
jgi:predicted phage terminase large subunit-like protein